MNLQTNRPPNLVQLHDARFEEINKEPKNLSNIKKTAVTNIEFDKMSKQKRHECLINADSNVGM